MENKVEWSGLKGDAETKRRKWESRQKFEIVLEGIKSGKISEICNRYQISQSVYYRWRDEFFEKGAKGV
ncbi:MAG TPA: transposase [bacterium]|nr:transposase [bacterium]HPP08728.1 transposase [bacterium]